MDMPSWVDATKLGIIAALTFMLVQYLKEFIPEKFVKLSAVPIAILVTVLVLQAEVNIYCKIVLYALFAVATADTLYGFLSGKGGATFKIPSKPV